MSAARRWLCILWLASTACAAAPVHPAPEVRLVVSAQSVPYLEFAAGLRSALEALDPPLHVRRIGLEAVAGLERSPRSIVVAAGVGAARAVASHPTGGPTIYTMLPRTALEQLRRHYTLGQAGHDYTAMFLDQPFARQLALVRAALPQAQRLAVLAGPSSHAEVGALFEAAARAGFTLVLEGITRPDDLVPALRRALPDADALLALPDAEVFNRNTVQNVLLTTYRYRVPVFAYSEGLLRAGAAYALYTSPRRLGSEVGALLARYLAAPERGLPSPDHPRDFEVDTNAHVARSLDLPLVGAADVQRRLRGAPAAETGHE